MRDNGGLVTAEDLAAYQPQVHEAVAGIPFADSEAFAVPGSNGGFTALETLGALHAESLARLQSGRIERLARSQRQPGTRPPADGRGRERGRTMPPPARSRRRTSSPSIETGWP